MPISWRLTGDRNVAAFYRGEANRLLFHLDQIFIDLPFGVLNRTMPDGSLISVLKLLGDRIVFIEGAGIQKAPQAIPLEAFYIMVYWSPTNIKFYTASFDPARISEYTQDLHPDIKVAYASQSDLLILNDSLNGSDPQKHIVNLGPTRDNWLRILGIGANIYSDRFWYRRFISGSLTGNIWFPYRQIDSFSKNDTAYSAYLPKVDSDNNIFWTEIYHNSYGLYADVRGPDNYTLAINDQKEEYAADWQGRIHQSGYGTGTASDYDLIGLFCWPVITTLNARKQPLVYSIKYEDSSGTQEIPNVLVDSLSFNIGPGGDFEQSYNAVSHWPIACLNGRRPFYIKNTLAYTPSTTGDGNNGTLYGEETLTQQLWAGSTLLMTASSDFKIDQVWTTAPVPLPHDSQYASKTRSTQLSGTNYSFLDVLAFSESQENLLVFIKKTSVAFSDFEIYYDMELIIDEYGNSLPGGTETNTLNIAASKIVEYILIAPDMQKTIAAFQQTMNYQFDDLWEIITINGNRTFVSKTYSGKQDGSGQRIHGVSCQANKKQCVFSGTVEVFTGTGSQGTDYLFYAPYITGNGGPWNHWLEMVPTEYPASGVGALATQKIPYPFPLEDQNTLIDGTTPCWTNQQLFVGAVRGNQEIDGLFDYVATPGAVGLVKGSV